MKAQNLKNYRVLTPEEFMVAMEAKEAKKSAGHISCVSRVSRSKENADRKAIRDLFGLSRRDMDAIEMLYDVVDYEKILSDLDDHKLRKLLPNTDLVDKLFWNRYGDVWGIKEGRKLTIAYESAGKVVEDDTHMYVVDNRVYKVACGWGLHFEYELPHVSFFYEGHEGTEEWVDKYYYGSYDYPPCWLFPK